MAALGELVVKLSANIAEFTSAMDKAAHLSQKRMDAMVKVAGQAGAAIGAALVTTAGSIAVAMKLAIDRMDELSESSQKLGLTTEALSSLEYIAGMSGVSIESLHGSINKLNKSIADGNPVFESMGISVRDASGELKSADVILKEMAGKFSGYKDGAAKSTLAMQAMGKAGAEMVPLLNQGADGFEHLTSEAEKMGLVIGGDSAESANRLNDALDRIGKTQQGIVTQMASQLLPVLEQGANEFEQVAKNIDLVSGPAKAMTVLFQTLAVLGSDVAFVFRMTGQEIGGIAAQINALGRGDFKGFSDIRESMIADAAASRVELDAFQARIMGIGTATAETANKVAKAGGGDGIAAPIVKSAKAAAKALDDLLTPAAKAYEKAIEQMNSSQLDADKSTRSLNGAQTALYELMSTAEWAKMPVAWQQTAIAQAGVATASIDAADKQKRLNDMIAATPTAKLEESRTRMLELKDAFESGQISAEQFSEAAGTYLGTLPNEIESMTSTIDTVITNSFQGMADAIADFVLTGKGSFSDLANAIIRDLIRIEIQTRMTEMFKAAGGMSGIFGSIVGFVTGSSSSSSSSASATPGVDFLGSGISGPRANGGMVSAGSSYLVGERGPEVLKMGSMAGTISPNSAPSDGAPSVVVNVSTPAGTQATQSTRQEGGKTIIDVLIDQVKSALINDVGRGGDFAGALEGTYAVNRSAGAWR